MEEKIEIIIIHDGNGVEPDTCYRLDDPESAVYCFNHFSNHIEKNAKHEFTIKAVTKKEWAEIERVGAEMA